MTKKLNFSRSEKMTDNAITLSQKIADFIVKAEFNRSSHETNDSSISQHFQEKEREISNVVKTIAAEIHHFKSLMTRAGAIQWHDATKNLLEESKKEVQSIEATYLDASHTIEQQCEKLNQSSMHTVKNVAQLVTLSKHNPLQKLSEEKSKEIRTSCETHLGKVEHTVRSFQWKNIAIAMFLSMVVSIIVSLYINDEWPWQAHDQVVKQREAGKILLDSWQQLSQSDRALIAGNA
jgi:hypothetical protein